MPRTNPKISIIMPSLNVGDYIEQCIKSAINQTLNDIEIICIDSGSTDNTLSVLEKYSHGDSRITLINSDKKSYGYQVNQGINKATGEYIAILETDDYIEDNMYESLYDLSENGSIDIVKGNFYHVDDYYKKNTIIKKDDAKKELSNINTKFTVNEEPLFIEGHPSIWAGIYRREFLEENNIQMLEEPGGGWVDNPFFYKTACCAKSIKYTDEAFYYYRESNPNSSSNNFTDYSLPMKRVLDIFDVLKNQDINDDVLLLFYNRLFRYIEIILENNHNSYTNLNYDICCYIQKVLKKVDKDKIDDLKPNFQKLYFKFMSPLVLMHFKKS